MVSNHDGFKLHHYRKSAMFHVEHCRAHGRAECSMWNTRVVDEVKIDPSAAKAALRLLDLTYGLKPVPFTLKPVPFKMWG
jgi:hypothetical protein